MFREFSVHPKPQNNNAKKVFGISFFVAFALFVVYFSMELYSGLVGVLAVAVLTFSILIYTKYIAAEYYYDLTVDANSCPVFVVRQITGRRQVTLCRIDVSSIMSVVGQTRQERKAHKTEAGTRKYSYAPTLMPNYTYLIHTVSDYETAEITIECSSEFAIALEKMAEEIRFLQSGEE